MSQQTSIPTVAVTARVYTQDGRPVAKASVSMRLTTVERFGGYIVPREVVTETDSYGIATVRVWPNALGTESSEYRVAIRVPDSYGARSVNGYAVVPNADCDLSDIMELPAHEARSAGSVIPAEVAGYAAQASAARDSAQGIYEATESTEQRLKDLEQSAYSSKVASQAAALLAQAKAEGASYSAVMAQETADNFESEVVVRVETEVNRLTNAAVLSVNASKNEGVQAIQHIAAQETTNMLSAVVGAKSDAVNTISVVTKNGIAEIESAGDKALSALIEEGELFQDDFAQTLETAQGYVRKVSCYIKTAERHAETACKCASDAEEAVRDMNTIVDNFTTTAANATSELQNIADTAKADLQAIADDIDAALVDKAVEALTPQIITEATLAATAEAQAARDAAVGAANEASTSASSAATSATSAISSASEANTALSLVSAIAGHVVANFNLAVRQISLAAKIMRSSNLSAQRFLKSYSIA